MFLDPKKDGEQTVKTIEPWRQLLLDAANYMQKHGHCAYAGSDEDGRVYIVGAIVWSYDGDGFDPLATLAIDKLTKFIGLNIPAWNQRHTGPEVIAAMRACANS